MLEVMQRLYNEKLTAEEALLPIGSNQEFWHCSILDENRFPVSGGFGEDRNIARKIAIAEFLERANYKNFVSNKETFLKWGLNLISTGCGFAVGFNRENTIIRSIAEAHERWVLSKWIDDDLFIEELPQTSIENFLDPASKFFASYFEKIQFFKKSLMIQVSGQFVALDVVITIGLKEKGAFIGSSAQLSGGNPWQHSLLESFRHLLGYRNNPKRDGTFPSNRLVFFAENADVALNQVYKNKNAHWPNPRINFHHFEHADDGNYYIARTIVDGWTSWKLGPVERFLY